MNIVKEIQEILEIQDSVEKIQKLDELDWTFENENFLESETLVVTSLLLDHTLNEENDAVKESIINALWSLTAKYPVSALLDWDTLVVQFPCFSRETDALIDSLDILGFSKNKKYLPVLETYLEDPSPFISSASIEAIVGIKLANHIVAENESKNLIEMHNEMLNQIKRRGEAYSENIDEVRE